MFAVGVALGDTSLTVRVPVTAAICLAEFALCAGRVTALYTRFCRALVQARADLGACLGQRTILITLEATRSVCGERTVTLLFTLGAVLTVDGSVCNALVV